MSRTKEQNAAYYQANKEKHAALTKRWREENSERHKENGRKWHERNKERSNENLRRFKELNPDYNTKYSKKRRETDPIHRLKCNMRTRMFLAIRAGRFKKQSSLTSYIGISVERLRDYLESKFKPGMSWSNYGQWHVDHVIPLASAKTAEEVYKLCHYTNLQPLWAIDNLSKGAKIL